MALKNLQRDINTGQAPHRKPAPEPSTPQKALAAEGQTLRPDGSIIPYDGIVNHDAQYGRNPQQEHKA